MKYRQEADYNPSYTFNPEDYVKFKKEAEMVMQRIRSQLKKAGYLKDVPKSRLPIREPLHETSGCRR